MIASKILLVLPLLTQHVTCHEIFGFSELLPAVLTKNTPNFLGYFSDDISAPAHILLHSVDNCSLPVTLTSGATDGGYVWTPHGGFPSGREFELELHQGGRVKRSKRFVLKERQFDRSSSSGFGATFTVYASDLIPFFSILMTSSTTAVTATRTGNSSPETTVSVTNTDTPVAQQPDAGSSNAASNANGAKSNTSNDSNNTSSSLSTGAAIGIGIAVGVVVIGALAAMALWWFRRYQRKHLYEPPGDRAEIGELHADDHRHEMAENVRRWELTTNANRHELSGSQKKQRVDPSELAAD